MMWADEKDILELEKEMNRRFEEAERDEDMLKILYEIQGVYKTLTYLELMDSLEGIYKIENYTWLYLKRKKGEF